MCATLERLRVFQRSLFFSGRAREMESIHSLQIDEPTSGARWSIFPTVLNCICVVSYGRKYLPEIQIRQDTIPFCTYATGIENIPDKYSWKIQARNFSIKFVWSAALNSQTFLAHFSRVNIGLEETRRGRSRKFNSQQFFHLTE